MMYFFWHGFQKRLEPDQGVESWNSLLRRTFNFGIEGEGILQKAGGGVEKGTWISRKEGWEEEALSGFFCELNEWSMSSCPPRRGSVDMWFRAMIGSIDFDFTYSGKFSW